MTVPELIESYGYEDVLIFDNPSYEDAFIGITEDGRAVYDYDLMVACLVKEDGMSEEEATDFISYNTIRSLPYYEDSPVVMYRIRREEL